MYSLIRWYLNRTIKQGNLTIIGADGQSHEFGDGTGVKVSVRLADRSLYWKLALASGRYTGEAYMNGSLTMEEGSIYDLLDLVASQYETDQRGGWGFVDRVRTHSRRIGRLNLIGRAQKNVVHHYDLSGEIYDLFLDPDRQYSCAYFEHPDQSLEDAQLAKKRHLAAKLALRSGMKVLDVGSGWGGLAIYLAEAYDVEVVGVTLSNEQHKLSRQRVKEKGLQDKVDIRLLDYRLLDEKFDRIISVGMFEHLGINHYGEYFQKLRDLLTDEGVIVLHSIGRPFGPGATNSWISRYIFPGGYIPALSEVHTKIERAGLYVCDVEVLRLHYALTLFEWRTRFLDNWDTAKNIYDETFCRMWEFYLAGSEVTFRRHIMNVFQIQITKHQDTLPITRDYMIEEESKLRNSNRN